MMMVMMNIRNMTRRKGDIVKKGEGVIIINRESAETGEVGGDVNVVVVGHTPFSQCPIDIVAVILSAFANPPLLHCCDLASAAPPRTAKSLAPNSVD